MAAWQVTGRRYDAATLRTDLGLPVPADPAG
ncbi:hypothetical protein JOD64_000406 [Micromonospora luteifusca]|uniref:Uncharacterized protein n=1 Tax=Micromonospora luteifusca TaxID=709860 RepID=A0ABS2LNE2_9ACTN|nr:hypothetical protein [Micromonospora luteifusca]